jgi:tetratricopeptide (TPR) repeat protein
MRDILQMQNELASAVVREVSGRLTPQEQSRLAQARPVNPLAYEAYLKGVYFFNKETDEGFEKALDYYQKSIDLDPSYAAPYFGLAETFGFMAYQTRRSPEEAWSRAEELLAKALEIDPASSQSHVLVGMIKLQFRCDRGGAERELKRALELNPNDMKAVDYHSYYLLETGRTQEAIAEKKRVLANDPVSVGTNAELGLYFLTAGRNDEAIQQFEKALELDPRFAMAHSRLGWAYANKRQFERAVFELKTAISLDPIPTRIGLLGEVYAIQDKAQEAHEVIAQLKEMSKKRYVPPTAIALIYTRLGEREQALTWFEKATTRDVLNLAESGFDSLRPDPRFKAVEARIKPSQSCPAF